MNEINKLFIHKKDYKLHAFAEHVNRHVFGFESVHLNNLNGVRMFLERGVLKLSGIISDIVSLYSFDIFNKKNQDNLSWRHHLSYYIRKFEPPESN